MLERLRALRDDRHPRPVKLNFGRRGHPGDSVGLEGVERRVIPQEAGYLRRRGGVVVHTVAGGATCATPGRASSLSMSAHFSPTIIVVIHGLMAGRKGSTEPSAIRSASTPRTRRRGSTTASGSDAGPM